MSELYRLKICVLRMSCEQNWKSEIREDERL